jgi:aryl-alcohol dehydrogenase-like predicted oxidoreductase
MQYTRLGKSGLVVSRLAFGVMTFGHDQGPMGAVWKTGQEEANALVQSQLEDNLGAANIQLSEKEVAELDAFTAPAPLYPNWFQAFATDAVVRRARDSKKMR